MCAKMMGFWQERDHWLHRDCNNEERIYKEIWDGDRFRELSWFWDPQQQWLLPFRCQECHSVINVVSTHQPLQDTEFPAVVDVTCSICGTVNKHIPKYARGNPRNIALIGHWDGWLPFQTAAHSCGTTHGLFMYLTSAVLLVAGAIDLSIATITKQNRCHTDDVFVVGFVPKYRLPKKRPCAIDPFLHPLLSDLEDGFIDGCPSNLLVHDLALTVTVSDMQGFLLNMLAVELNFHLKL